MFSKSPKAAGPCQYYLSPLSPLPTCLPGCECIPSVTAVVGPTNVTSHKIQLHAQHCRQEAGREVSRGNAMVGERQGECVVDTDRVQDQ